MRKCAFMAAIVLLCLVFIAPAMAADEQKAAPKQKEVMVDRSGDGVIDGVDIYDDSGKVTRRGYDTNNDRFVDTWQERDENTGMPIVTQSDKAFELKF